MMRKRIFLFVLLALVVLWGSISVFSQKFNQPEEAEDLLESEQKTSVPSGGSEIVIPIAEFEKRITKKPFGIYITPQNSPVQPERFTGYHTGVDVEYEDVTTEVPVFAVNDGELVLAKWVSGYGGTIVLKSHIEDQEVYVLYGHLDLQSLTENVQVEKGEPIAVLGKGQSQEKDFERKHLHFAIIKNKLDLRGYVKEEKELSGWYNPLDFYKKVSH
jgi:murein DD-endopeptidase MepM/ murein hydrolase activator NlpD